MSRTKAIVSGRSDAELIASSRAGDTDAYAELYNRHVDGARAAARALSRSKADTDDIVAEAFSRVLSALRRGGGPDVSFRPYLLTAVRNSFYDRTRRAKREEVTDEPDDIVSLSALDAANSGEDRAMVAVAFASLPERWQLVLWHTEVEGMTPAEVAPLVGLAPNAASALAYRAREGLRQAYLQSHLQQNIPAECSECAPKLGAYVRDGLAARERRRVDDHLTGCESCRTLLAELNEANGHLRAVLVPLLLGVPAAKYLAGLQAGKGALGLLRNAPRPQQLLGGAAAAAAVAAAVSISFISLRNNDQPPSSAAKATSSNVRPGIEQAGAAGTPGSQPIGDEAAINAPLSTLDDPDAPLSSGVDNGAELDASITAPDNTASDSGAQNKPATEPSAPAEPASPSDTTDTTTPTTASTPTSVDTPDSTPTATTDPTPNIPSTTLVASQPPVPPTTVKPPDTVAPPATDPPAPVQPAIEATLGGFRYAGGVVSAQIVIRNSATNAPATHPVFKVVLPGGFTFDPSTGAPWKCRGVSSAICELPTVASGGSSSATLNFHVGIIPPGTATFTMSLTSDNLPPITRPASTFISSGIAATDTLQYSNVDRGSVFAIGNTNLSCDETQDGCLDARAGVGTQLNRQSFTMTNVVDPTAAAGQFNASSATLDLGQGSVSRAFLLWAADLTAGDAKAADPATKGVVRFTSPTGVVSDVVAGSSSSYGDGSRYSALSDVTQFVGGSGVYQVGNVQAAEGLGSFAGWSLIVVTHDDSAPLRALAVITPNANVDKGSPYNGTIAVPMTEPTRDATVAVVTFEGDLGYKPDALSLNGQQLVNDANPANNQLNSSTAGATDALGVNSFGVDVDVFDTAVTGSSLNLKATSSNEAFRVAAVAVAVDL